MEAKLESCGDASTRRSERRVVTFLSRGNAGTPEEGWSEQTMAADRDFCPVERRVEDCDCDLLRISRVL